MTPIPEELYGDIAATASRPDFADWICQVRSTGGCAEPIRLYGHSRTVHAATGEILSQLEPGRLLVACGYRRKTRCPSCSETYRADTFQLIKAGLLGGKSVPDTVAAHPRVFATFTAPSFGPVHHRTSDPNGNIKPCHPYGSHRCGRTHRPDDPVLGQPLEPDSYDYTGAVVWNALATRLWARTVQLANRKAALLLGIPQRHWKHVGRVSVAKVAEYQARGLVHFHAIFRLDGPEPDAALPDDATVETLEEAIRQAAQLAAIELPHSPLLAGRGPVTWGDQLDLRPVAAAEDGEGTLSDGQVAGYVAKYATKGAEASGTADRTIACRCCAGQGRYADDSGADRYCQRCHGQGTRHELARLNISEHARRMIQTCWELGGRPELLQLRLRPWAHMLGFRGHFATKSRRYSTTLSRLRNARRDWQDDRTRHAHGLPPDTRFVRPTAGDLEGVDPGEETVMVIGHWAYAGRGHTPGEAAFAASVAADIVESRRIYRQLRAEEAA